MVMMMSVSSLRTFVCSFSGLPSVNGYFPASLPGSTHSQALGYLVPSPFLLLSSKNSCQFLAVHPKGCHLDTPFQGSSRWMRWIPTLSCAFVHLITPRCVQQLSVYCLSLTLCSGRRKSVLPFLTPSAPSLLTINVVRGWELKAKSLESGAM